jgi:cell wall-associated NlpC family hydrolase
MHYPRLVGGLISVAALLTVLLVSSALVTASPPAGPRAIATAAFRAPAMIPSAAGGPTASSVTFAGRHWPALSKVQKHHRLQVRRRRTVVRIARSLRGVPYVYGGASRGGFDCSGLTMYVYERVGISLSHGATDQAHRGRRVSLRHLKAGDLVFYGGSGYYYHVAVYAGRGLVIDAPHSGAVVSYSRLAGAAAARRLIG